MEFTEVNREPGPEVALTSAGVNAMELFTPEETAKKLGVSDTSLKLWRKNGTGLQYYRLSERIIRYMDSDIDEYLKAKELNLSRLIEKYSLDRNGHTVPVISELPGELRPIEGLLSKYSMTMGVIYFLCKDRKVVYVGRSAKLESRIKSHRKRKDFDAAYFMWVPLVGLDEIEEACISTLRPKLNKTLVMR